MTDWTSSSSGFPATAPNLSRLPYTARYKGVAAAGRTVVFGAGLVVFLAIGLRLGAEPGAPFRYRALILAGLAVGVVILLLSLWRLRRPRAVFYADRIEAPGLLRTSVLHRSNIKGVRVVRTRGGFYLVVVSASPAEPDITLDGAFKSDPVITDWLRGAPDPDALDQRADRAAILGDDRYGATEAARSSRLAEMGQVALIFNGVCVALALYVGVLARFDLLTLLLAIAPLLVAVLIVAASKGLVTWLATNSAHPMVIGAVAPAVALAARSAMFVHLVDNPAWSQEMLLLGVLALFVAVMVWRTRLASGWKALGLAPLAALTAWGVAVAADVCLDTSPPQLFVTSVTGKRVAHHTKGGPTYYVGVDHWSDRPAEDISVSPAFYDSIVDGQYICVSRRRGALAQAWFTVDHCPPGLGFSPVGSAGDPTDAVWTRPATPQDLAELFPQAARLRGIDGYATLRCAGQTTGVMSDCRVIQENPAGLGFGAATLQLAPRLRARPRAAMGNPAFVGPIAFTIHWLPPQR